MYLTKLELDPAKRRCAMALAAPNLFHGAIEDAFRTDSTSTCRERKLWRLDTLGGRPILLLLSESKPCLVSMEEQFGIENGWESRSYDTFLSGIDSGDRRRFRLTANPVITKSAGKGNRGEVLAHVTVAQQEKWLADRAEKHGFALAPDEFSVVGSRWVNFRKSKENRVQVAFHAVTYEGILQVTNADLFRMALCEGIGREKAYGCGLLTVLGKMP